MLYSLYKFAKEGIKLKIFTKLTSLLLVIAVFFGIFALPVVAADASAEDEIVDDPIVARMYVGHNERYRSLSGHTWIYIENLTDHSIQVGAYTVQKGKGVSVGTFGTSLADGVGLYYNVEAWRYRNYDVTEYIHLSKEITQSQLEIVSNKIINGGTWSYILNCAYFAFGVWNSVPGKPLIFLFFPTLHELQILLYMSHGAGIAMTVPKSDEIFKQIGKGEDAFLVVTDPSFVEDDA